MTLSELATDNLLPELFRDEVFRLETRRLWLRWPSVADAPALAEIAIVAACKRPRVRWPRGWDGQVGSISGLIQHLRAANASGEGCFLGVVDKSRQGQLIGLVGLDVTAADGPSLGFMLDVRRQGFGVMTEAARALMAATFRYSRTTSVRGDTTLAGIGARRVLEKCAFRPRGLNVAGEPVCAAFEAHRADAQPWALPHQSGMRAA